MGKCDKDTKKNNSICNYIKYTNNYAEVFKASVIFLLPQCEIIQRKIKNA